MPGGAPTGARCSPTFCVLLGPAWVGKARVSVSGCRRACRSWRGCRCRRLGRAAVACLRSVAAPVARRSVVDAAAVRLLRPALSRGRADGVSDAPALPCTGRGARVAWSSATHRRAGRCRRLGCCGCPAPAWQRGCAADVSVRRLGVLSGASVGTACWRQGRAACASVVHRVLALRARRVCLFGVWSAVTHLAHPPAPPLCRSGCRSCCRCSCSAQNGPGWPRTSS